MTLTIGSLCTGYGGLEMAVEQVLDARTAWVSDIDKGACKVLAHRYPNVPNIGDMTAVDWLAVEPVEIITAGYPCQPFSHAGRRKGANDDRHLWPAVREAIRNLRPRLTLLENVAGHRSLGFDRVLGDLAEDGMDVGWTSIRASDAGAPHRRERLFIAAVPPDADLSGFGGVGRELAERRNPDGRSGANGSGPAAESAALLPTPVADNSRGLPSGGTNYQSLPNAVCGLLPTPTARDWKNVGDPDKTAARMAERGQPLGEVVVNALESDCYCELGYECVDCARRRIGRREGGTQAALRWGAYAAAIARWESITRPAPAPTELSAKGTPRLSPAFTEWMMGLPAGWITDTPGVTRNEALKLCGNGVVPQQAVAAIQFLLGVIGEQVAA